MSRGKLHGVEPPVVPSVGEVGSHAEAAFIVSMAHLKVSSVLHPHLSESPIC